MLDDMQKSGYSNIAKFSRLFNEILVDYQYFSGWQDIKLEFVSRRNIPHSIKVGIYADSHNYLLTNNTMRYRCSVKTNDKYAYFYTTFVFILFAAGLGGIYDVFHNNGPEHIFSWQGDTDPKLVMFFFNVLFGSIFFSCIFHLIFPKEFEFIFSDKSIYWGRADKSKKRNVLNINDISKIIFKYRPGEPADHIYFLMKNNKKIQLPEYILRTKSRCFEFKEFLEKFFPEMILLEGYPKKND